MSLEKDPNRWDVNTRSKTSAFAWRGQFTPDFVSLVFDEFDTKQGLVLDPFMGSGTVLLEAIARNRPSFGTEINPAAYFLSHVFTLANLRSDQRSQLVQELADSVAGLTSDSQGNFFKSLVNLILEEKDGALLTLLRATLLVAAKDSADVTTEKLSKSLDQVGIVLSDLPTSSASIRMDCSDARAVRVEPESVGFVVTSPPYINVFNYHQNYRPSVEALGWNVLEKAQAEIGSNRKHRSNRLLTVIQYTLDMMMMLEKLTISMMDHGVIVLVVGRESNVRGLPFMNSEIIEDCVKAIPQLSLREKHERKFRSRYGAMVYEDILVVTKSKSGDLPQALLETARSVAKEHLKRQLHNCPAEVLEDLEQAIERVSVVQPSPIH